MTVGVRIAATMANAPGGIVTSLMGTGCADVRPRAFGVTDADGMGVRAAAVIAMGDGVTLASIVIVGAGSVAVNAKAEGWTVTEPLMSTVGLGSEAVIARAAGVTLASTWTVGDGRLAVIA